MAGIKLNIAHPEIASLPITETSSPVAVSDSSMTVQNASDYAVNNLLLLRGLGDAKTEIVAIHASTAPTDTTITFNASLEPRFDHPTGTTVQTIPYNQIVIQRSTDGGVNYSTLATVDITVDQPFTVYNDTTGLTTYYYRYQYSNSVTAQFSIVSNVVPGSGLTEPTAGEIIRKAAGMANVDIGQDNNIVPYQYLIDELNDLKREIWSLKQRWSWAFVANYNLGTLQEDQASLSLPTNIAYEDFNGSIMYIRVRTWPELYYLSKEEYDLRTYNSYYTTLASNVAVIDTTIDLVDAANFDDSGTIVIFGDSISYTAKSGNTLTGVTGITTTHTTGDDIWQNPSTGQPVAYAVFNGSIWFFPVCDATNANRTVSIDYYKTFTPIEDDDDVLEIPDPLLAQYYLAWKIRIKIAGDDLDAKLTMFQQMYERQVRRLLTREKDGQKDKWGIRPTPMTKYDAFFRSGGGSSGIVGDTL